MTTNKIETTDATLCFVQNNGKILLITKKRGFGMGKINGPGGKVKPPESIANAAIRETLEETGIKPINLQKKAILDFYFGVSDYPMWKVHVYHTQDFTGKLIETEEARGEWFELNEIPYDLMWEDDKYWLPRILSGEHLRGKFWFSEDMKQLLSHNLIEIPRSELIDS